MSTMHRYLAEKYKFTSITAKVYITSLNSHFPELYSGTKCREHKNAEPVTPYLLSLNQDIVAGSEMQKCGLKYVMLTPGGPSFG